MITVKLNIYGEEHEITTDKYLLCYLRNELVEAADRYESNGYNNLAAENRRISKEFHKAIKESELCE